MGEVNELQCPSPGCNRVFESKRSLSSHRAWHTRKDKKHTASLVDLFGSPIPPDFKRKVDLEIDKSGTLKISVEVEPTKGEEVSL